MDPVAKRKTLFDDRPVEISELTYIIKRDIASLNQQIAKLQSIVQAGQGSGKGKQAEEHSNNVIVMLQGKLASTSMGFKDVLELRTQARYGWLCTPQSCNLTSLLNLQNMKASKARTDQFGYTSSAGLSNAPPAGEMKSMHHLLMMLTDLCKFFALVISHRLPQTRYCTRLDPVKRVHLP